MVGLEFKKVLIVKEKMEIVILYYSLMMFMFKQLIMIIIMKFPQELDYIKQIVQINHII